MTWNMWVRRVHRWVSVAFTAAVVINLLAMGSGDVAPWVGILALVPLLVLLFTGLYLFVLPYATNWRRG